MLFPSSLIYIAGGLGSWWITGLNFGGVNDGFCGRVFRMSGVEISSDCGLKSWWAGVESQDMLHDYSPTSWGAQAEEISVADLRKVFIFSKASCWYRCASLIGARARSYL